MGGEEGPAAALAGAGAVALAGGGGAGCFCWLCDGVYELDKGEGPGRARLLEG